MANNKRVAEAEWAACSDVELMLDSLRGTPSQRKLRLLAVACVQPFAHLLTDQRSRAAVEVAERFANGRATWSELVVAERAATVAYSNATWPKERIRASVERAAAYCAASAGWWAASQALKSLLFGFRKTGTVGELQLVQAALIREIFGNPFQPAHVDVSWLRWNDGTVPRIAQGIYEERAFDRLPILHDALLDAGCDNDDILAHCRGAGPHVRGCWVIDLLLGKE